MVADAEMFRVDGQGWRRYRGQGKLLDFGGNDRPAGRGFRGPDLTISPGKREPRSGPRRDMHTLRLRGVRAGHGRVKRRIAAYRSHGLLPLIRLTAIVEGP